MTFIILGVTKENTFDNNLSEMKIQDDFEADENPCFLPLKVGNCRKAARKWYFDESTIECKEFIYGGCEGNGNNFPSKSECELRCLAETDDDNIHFQTSESEEDHWANYY